jgi:hypothetical protein
LRFTDRFGVKSTATGVIKKVEEAVTKGALKALDLTLPFQMDRVARKTGFMRRQIAGVLGSQILFSASDGTITIDMSDGAINKMGSYTKYHTRGHADFNPKFAGGYKNPTTAGTAPIDRKKILQVLKAEIMIQVNRELRKVGLK